MRVDNARKRKEPKPIMARTQMPELTGERLSNLISLWLMSASTGQEQPIDRIETTVKVMRICGFTPELINTTIATAANAVSLDPNDAVARFGLEIVEKM